MADAYQNNVPITNDVRLEPYIQERLQVIYTNMCMWVDRKQYQFAASHMAEARQAYDSYHSGLKPDCGSVEYNVVEHIFCDIASLASDTLNRQFAARRNGSPDGCEGPHMLTRELEVHEVGFAIGFAHMSLQFAGITDIKRFYGHYRRAVAYANMADYMTELNTVVPEPERTKLLSASETPAAWTNAPRSYKCAAQDAFFAFQIARLNGVAVPQKLIDDIRALHSRSCGRIGLNADEHYDQMCRAGLARFQLPLLGLWEGDPALSEAWGPDRMMLMALFRRREQSDVPTDEALWDELAQSGIHWVHDESGQISLKGPDEAHMTPTLVMPDNTRDGLRAAGLSGDKFEMARR